MHAQLTTMRGWMSIATAFAIGAFGSSMARADIYTWFDAAGSLNVSNVAPPEGVAITKVVPDSPPRPQPAPGTEADARRQAEVQMLAERLQQLERQVGATPPPQPVVMYAPPLVNTQPQVQYTTYDSAPPSYPQNASCDPGWTDCGTWPNGIPNAPPYAYYPYTYFYPASVLVVRNGPHRRYDPPGRNMPPRYGGPGGNRNPMPMPSPRPAPNIVAVRTR